MKDAGYMLNIKFVLQKVLDTTTKEDFLCGHTKKLAMDVSLSTHHLGHHSESTRIIKCAVTTTMQPNSFPRLFVEK